MWSIDGHYCNEGLSASKHFSIFAKCKDLGLMFYLSPLEVSI